MVIPNIVTKFQKFDIFYQIWYIFDLSSVLSGRAVSPKLVQIEIGGRQFSYLCGSSYIPMLHGQNLTSLSQYHACQKW